MTFAEALKTPTGGYVHANTDQMLAGIAETVGGLMCLQPAALYKWAKRHGLDAHGLTRFWHKWQDSPLDFVGIVLDDLPPTTDG